MLQILLLSPPFDISMVGLVFWQTLHQSGFISPFLIDFIESERVSLARWFGCARLRARSWRKIKRKMLGTWGRERSVLWSISSSLNHSIIDVMTVINGEYSRSVGWGGRETSWMQCLRKYVFDSTWSIYCLQKFIRLLSTENHANFLQNTQVEHRSFAHMDANIRNLRFARDEGETMRKALNFTRTWKFHSICFPSSLLRQIVGWIVHSLAPFQLLEEKRANWNSSLVLLLAAAWRCDIRHWSMSIIVE